MDNLAKVGVSFIASTAVSEAVSANTLVTALITLGISLVTVAGGELLKLIVAWLKKKTKDIEEGDKKEDK